MGTSSTEGQLRNVFLLESFFCCQKNQCLTSLSSSLRRPTCRLLFSDFSSQTRIKLARNAKFASFSELLSSRLICFVWFCVLLILILILGICDLQHGCSRKTNNNCCGGNAAAAAAADHLLDGFNFHCCY